jgi:hypothetical protein
MLERMNETACRQRIVALDKRGGLEMIMATDLRPSEVQPKLNELAKGLPKHLFAVEYLRGGVYTRYRWIGGEF